MSTVYFSDILATLSRFFQTNPPLLDPSSISLEAKTVLITGVNTGGIGYHIAEQLCQLREPLDKLILAVRNVGKGEAAKASLVDTIQFRPENVEVRHLDLLSFFSVRSFVESLQRDNIRIDVAILNAGVMNPARKVSEDGFEEMLQVNHLSTAYLSLLLLPILREDGRLTIVGSDAVYVTNFSEHKLNEPLLEQFNTEEGYRNMEQYSVSKFLIWFFARGLAERGIHVNLVSPGITASELWRNTPRLSNYLFRLLGSTTMVGARPIVRAAVEVGKESFGEMVMGGGVIAPPRFIVTDEGKKTQERVWRETLDVLRSQGLGRDVEELIV